MKSRYTGFVDATCPTCDQVVNRQSAQSRDLGYLRDLLKNIADAYRRWYPFAQVKTVDPLVKQNSSE